MPLRKWRTLLVQTVPRQRSRGLRFGKNNYENASSTAVEAPGEEEKLEGHV